MCYNCGKSQYYYKILISLFIFHVSCLPTLSWTMNPTVLIYSLEKFITSCFYVIRYTDTPALLFLMSLRTGFSKGGTF